MIGTIMTLVFMVYLWLEANFQTLASAAPDPLTGRIHDWPFFGRRIHAHFVTHDQYWALAVTGGIFVACFFVLAFAPRGYRELGED